MKRLTLLAVIIGFSGCEAFYKLAKPEPKFEDPEMAELYARYQAINPNRLTAEQEVLVVRFNSLEPTKEDWEWLKNFPWINPNALSKRDKVFVMEVAREVVASMRISDASAASASNQ